jgi:hypothetical protein
LKVENGISEKENISKNDIVSEKREAFVLFLLLIFLLRDISI